MKVIILPGWKPRKESCDKALHPDTLTAFSDQKERAIAPEETPKNVTLTSKKQALFFISEKNKKRLFFSLIARS
ncbi:MAG: hypothetical protein AAFP03_07120, partial [Cyanobacteria bacterium J06598_3]